MEYQQLFVLLMCSASKALIARAEQSHAASEKIVEQQCLGRHSSTMQTASQGQLTAEDMFADLRAIAVQKLLTSHVAMTLHIMQVLLGFILTLCCSAVDLDIRCVNRDPLMETACHVASEHAFCLMPRIVLHKQHHTA